MMDATGAYGGGKAGGAFDPKVFVQRPPVIVRAVCWLFATIVMGCISDKGWRTKDDGKTYCVYNEDTNACNYGVGISVIAFMASIAFIAGEYLFERMSSVKTRKHYVLADMGFSAFWAFLYFVGFCYLSNAWGKTESPPVGTANNMQCAIAFCFFSIFAWVACAFFAFQRFRMGAEAAFAPAYEVEGAVGSPGSFPTYPGAADAQPAYSDPPFSQNNATESYGNIDYTAPTY